MYLANRGDGSGSGGSGCMVIVVWLLIGLVAVDNEKCLTVLSIVRTEGRKVERVAPSCLR